ncbi:MAG: DUF6049 family protein [Actinomycetota bacterium]
MSSFLRAPLAGSLARHLLACLALAAVALGLPASPAEGRAQDPDETVTVELVDQPVSYDENGVLDIKVRVTNTSPDELEGFTLIVERGGLLTSRSALQNSYDTVVVGLAIAAEEVQKTLDPGSSRIVTIDAPVTELFSEGTESEGVYAATVSLLDASGVVPLDSFITSLMYYPNEVEDTLNFVPVVPLGEIPARGPDGNFGHSSLLGDQTLEQAIGRDGWLMTTLSQIAKRTGSLRLGIGPTPRLIEEIADMSDGYRRGDEEVSDTAPEAAAATEFLERLGDLLESDSVQPLLAPYADPDLPSLAASEVDAHVNEQVAHGEAVLQEILENEPGRSWILAPAGRIDSAALEQLQTGGALDGGTFFSADSLEAPDDPLLAGCPIESLSLTCPVSVETPLGTTGGYVSDEGLQEHLSALVREDNDRLNLQRFFAETAMIRQEQPSRGDRILQATLPAAWRPENMLIKILYRGLERAPWLTTVTPAEGLDLDIEAVDREVADSVSGVSNALDGFGYSQIATADAMVESFNSIDPPPDLTERLLRNVFVAESRLWWQTPELAQLGESYATSSFAQARTELDQISLEVNERITLTSRAEDIPVRVVNDAGYPIRVRLRLDSQKLAFDGDEVQTFDVGRTPLAIPVRATSSGIFPLTLALVTPDGSTTIAESRPSVRSTEFNNIALVITVGALLFLVAFYALRWYRKRNAAAREV